MRKKDVLSEINCYCSEIAEYYENHPVCFPLIIDIRFLCNFPSCAIGVFFCFKSLEKDNKKGQLVDINCINNRPLM